MYPTKEEILSHPHKVKEIDTAVLTVWKKNFYNDVWGKSSKTRKIELLAYLLTGLNLMYMKDNPLNAIGKGMQYSYNPEEKEITLDKTNPSILSTLHEFAHHILGPSELEACVWSIRLFEKVFPKEFKKLHWEGHMLKLAK